MKIGIIGFGNMGRALAEGIISDKKFTFDDVVVSDKNKKKISIAKKKGFKTAGNKEVAKESDVIILSVKPSFIEEVIEEINPVLDNRKLLISIAAGVKIKSIENRLKRKTPVIRVMPNLNVKVKMGIIVYCKGKYAKDKKYDLIFNETFSSLGIVMKMPEDKFDTITAISGSGPGFIFYIADVLEKICEKKEIESKKAVALVKGLFYGSGKMLFESEKTPQELKNMVCSPKGTTIAGIEVFEKINFPKIFEKVVNKSEKRSKQLSKERR
ncbi:pyrroline-5-carboxylate reductase [bacterium]|nr:pyrroline-5-carboxylate reductase [bacterium]